MVLVVVVVVICGLGRRFVLVVVISSSFGIDKFDAVPLPEHIFECLCIPGFGGKVPLHKLVREDPGVVLERRIKILLSAGHNGGMIIAENVGNFFLRFDRDRLSLFLRLVKTFTSEYKCM